MKTLEIDARVCAKLEGGEWSGRVQVRSAIDPGTQEPCFKVRVRRKDAHACDGLRGGFVTINTPREGQLAGGDGLSELELLAGALLTYVEAERERKENARCGV